MITDNPQDATNAATDATHDAPVVEARLFTHLTEAFANPTDDGGLPRVLLIGDSISIGYTVPVRVALQGVASVHRPHDNCAHSAHGLAHLDAWLGSDRWDVIHFNFGIWDTHLLDAAGNLVRSNEEAAPSLPGQAPCVRRLRHTPEQYRDHLALLLTRLRATGAALIWASTTPVLCRTPERLQAIPTLNRVATAYMREQGVPVNELYDFVMPQVREWQDPDQCHFNATGNHHLGQRVAAQIQAALATRSGI